MVGNYYKITCIIYNSICYIKLRMLYKIQFVEYYNVI